VSHSRNKRGNEKFPGIGDIAKTVRRGKFIAMTAYSKRTERSQINDLMLHLKLLEKQEKAEPKPNRRREIIRSEINELEIKNKPYKEAMKQKDGSFFFSVKFAFFSLS
jgi:hypothetical protein